MNNQNMMQNNLINLLINNPNLNYMQNDNLAAPTTNTTS